MALTIKRDNRSQQFPMNEGKVLPYTVYENEITYAFCETQAAAEAEVAERIAYAKVRVRRLKAELKDATDYLKSVTS